MINDFQTTDKPFHFSGFTGMTFQPQPQAQVAPLGNLAKSQAGTDSALIRLEKFAMQSVARRAMGKDHRVSLCLRARAMQQAPTIWKSIEHQSCHWKGLQTCGSVWTCPVCASKISEFRRHELRSVLEQHKELGGYVYMLTFTTPHTRQDDLSFLIKRQGDSLTKFWGLRTMKGLFQGLGLQGKIRAFEVTHGRKSPSNNGWHPHFHYLIFLDKPIQDLPWTVQSVFNEWRKVCLKAGLEAPSQRHGVSIDGAERAADYVSKWGLENEMTKAHLKKGKSKGETPFDLLRAYLQDSTDKQALALFKEYSLAFKGKRQLTWSPGFKKTFNLEEIEDEQIASGADEKSILLGALDLEQWRDVLFTDTRAHLLTVAERSGWSGVQTFLEVIQGSRDPGFHPLSRHELDELVLYASCSSALRDVSVR